MKQFNFIAYLFFGLSIFLLISCGNEEDDPETDNLVGKYQLTSVKLAEDFELADTVAIPNGTDMTLLIQNLLFGSVNCSNPQNTRIELQENGQILLLCEGENKSTQNGTWSVNDQRSNLMINVNVNFQGNPIIYQLTLEDMNETGSTVSGTVKNVLLPPEVFMAFGLDISGTTYDNPDFNMTITKVN